MLKGPKQGRRLICPIILRFGDVMAIPPWVCLEHVCESSLAEVVKLLSYLRSCYKRSMKVLVTLYGEGT